MNPEEITKKDWQLLTAYSEITALSYLRSIFENQAFIISELTKKPHSEVLSEMEKNRLENYKSTMKLVKDNIPDYK